MKCEFCNSEYVKHFRATPNLFFCVNCDQVLYKQSLLRVLKIAKCNNEKMWVRKLLRKTNMTKYRFDAYCNRRLKGEGHDKDNRHCCSSDTGTRRRCNRGS